MTNPTSWTVRVDWLDHTAGPNEAELEQLLDKLAGLHPAINLEHPDQPGAPVRMCATLTLDAATLRQASATALAAVEGAIARKALGIEVLPTHEFDRMLERPQIPELVGNADIADMLGVSRQRAAQLADLAGFPPAVTHIKAGPLRVRRQVEHWAATWERKTGRPPKTS